MTEFDLGGFLQSEGEAVDRALERSLDHLPESVRSDVDAAARHGVLSGGKRLRPILCVAAFRACGGVAPRAAIFDLAVALELIHAYSLMHDDLPCMDDADLRRGRPTTHREHGVTVTALAGLALIPYAALQARRGCEALGISPDARDTAIRVLTGAAGAGGMVGGQGLDLLGEGEALGPEDLGELHRHKTGALLKASLEIGAIAAGAHDDTRGALRAYGEHIGLAFQIADDVLDATATAEELGKEPSDVELDKSTYVALFGLEGARSRARGEIDAALTALDGAGLAAPELRALAEYVVSRRK